MLFRAVVVVCERQKKCVVKCGYLFMYLVPVDSMMYQYTYLYVCVCSWVLCLLHVYRLLDKKAVPISASVVPF